MSSFHSLLGNSPISRLRLGAAVLCFLAIISVGTRIVRARDTQDALVLAPLNVREGPGTEHAVVGHARKGSRLQISWPDADGWAAVRRGSRTVGYVRALPRYVRMDAGGSRPAGGASALLLLGIATAGAWVVARGRAGSRPSIPTPVPTAAPWAPADVTRTAPYPVSAAVAPAAPQAEDGASERNGREFEEWAARRLGTAPFRLIDWRGDKYVDGVFAESTLAPDLVVEWRDGPTRIRFAVECKWRSRFRDDALQWGEWKHLRRYRDYAAQHGIPVYLLVGVGGHGGDPHETYLVPLEAVEFPTLYLRELRTHDRVRGDGRFVFDSDQGLRLLPA